eukprot:TRINITY_DN25416_c0_g1_i1.p1 TRINITY_DN25416_c0_g1~~TRINITY_DN25416_c0_g1_i1.p1  ORF type:complete len:104 (-),score=29.29 TRINITY_DN25416_c0_g1_i1:395-706(-)
MQLSEVALQQAEQKCWQKIWRYLQSGKNRQGLDLNKDGRLDRGEVVRLLAKAGVTGEMFEQFAETFDQLSEDVQGFGSGFVSLHEFLEALDQLEAVRAARIAR